MFGGVAAKVNGHLFAGLFGRSTMLLAARARRAAALALDGATMFDPMGDGRLRSDKVMLPESIMRNPKDLRAWIARAFNAAAMLPKKAAKAPTPAAGGASKKTAAKRSAPKGPPEESARSAGEPGGADAGGDWCSDEVDALVADHSPYVEIP